MILWLGIGTGLMVGLGRARWSRYPYQSPKLRHIWLVIPGFLPQFFAIYLGNQVFLFPDWAIVFSVLLSQIILLVFTWLNRQVSGMLILMVGLLLNLAVMSANNGFMPISPATAGRLVSAERLSTLESGSRFGYKDILLPADETRLELLADRFLPPAGFPYQVAFSLGDVFIAMGAFWILAFQNTNI